MAMVHVNALELDRNGQCLKAGMFPYKYCGMDTEVLRGLHQLWGWRVGDSMQCPLGTSLVHRGKSEVQKPAGLGTLSKPTKTVFCSWSDLPGDSAVTSLLWQKKVL